MPAILSDNRLGGRLAARHVLDLGHRRIGHVTAPPRNAAAGERLAGIRDALQAADDDTTELIVVEGDGGVDGGEAATRNLLARMPGISAVLCYNDLTAIGAVRAIRSAGLRVPADVSVVGYDDIAIAAWVEPALTTVAQDTTAMGRWAVERLVERIAGRAPDASPPEVVLLPVELRVRASSGPPPPG
ncbi:MAG: LacI family transcriptional regulator [Chloroflexi bacterium]|nr:MAG: LacI family transcriptional regulator [Chloroflexota bacterium]